MPSQLRYDMAFFQSLGRRQLLQSTRSLAARLQSAKTSYSKEHRDTELGSQAIGFTNRRPVPALEMPPSLTPTKAFLRIEPDLSGHSSYERIVIV